MQFPRKLDIYREAAREDIKAYILSVYVRASIRTLSEIINANLPHYYFQQLGNALNNAFVFGNIIVAHLTAIWRPEIVARDGRLFSEARPDQGQMSCAPVAISIVSFFRFKYSGAIEKMQVSLSSSCP
ncbi:MAG: hypothetical protein U5P10_11900 [Spirochaetia bacterium]|nr:hypothetical protein [Spirochaetia bacterium]